MWFDEFTTPIGLLRIAVDATGLRCVMFENNKYDAPDRSEWRPDKVVTREARTWQTLASIPYGQTWSYSELANRVGSPKAVRAVGAANGRNPLPIVLPCHRVIGSNGTLTGFGGGLPVKKWLLEHESGLQCSEKARMANSNLPPLFMRNKASVVAIQ